METKRLALGFLFISLVTSLNSLAGNCPLWGDYPRPEASEYDQPAYLSGYLSWDAAYEEALHQAKKIAQYKTFVGRDDHEKICSIEFVSASACHPMWGRAGRTYYKEGEVEQLMKLKVKVNYSSKKFVLTGFNHTYSGMVLTGLVPLLPIGNDYTVKLKTDINNQPIEFSFSKRKVRSDNRQDVICRL